jgi:hypothetical protein
LGIQSAGRITLHGCGPAKAKDLRQIARDISEWAEQWRESRATSISAVAAMHNWITSTPEKVGNRSWQSNEAASGFENVRVAMELP